MQLNHINLVVSNVADTIRLFESYFDFKCTEVKGDNIIAVLEGADRFTLVIMTAKTEQVIYPSAFHIGFMLDSENEVHQIYEQLQTGGISVDQAPRKIRDSFGFYFHFDSIMIEVAHYLV